MFPLHPFIWLYMEVYNGAHGRNGEGISHRTEKVK